jgi:hypothetical protein
MLCPQVTGLCLQKSIIARRRSFHHLHGLKRVQKCANCLAQVGLWQALRATVYAPMWLSRRCGSGQALRAVG